MLGAFLTFLVLLGLIKVFERKRDDLDNFSVVMVAVVPVICVVLVNWSLAIFYPDPALQAFLPLLVLIGVTFALLWKNLEIPVGRAIGYTVAVVLVNGLLGFMMTSGYPA